MQEKEDAERIISYFETFFEEDSSSVKEVFYLI